MAIQEILVPFSGLYDPEDPGAFDKPALNMALFVANLYQAHVQVLCITREPDEPDEHISAWMPGYAVSEIINWMHKIGDERQKRAKTTFERSVAECLPKPVITEQPSSTFSASFTEITGDIRDTVGKWGRASDLVVVATSKTRWEMPNRPLLESSLRRTGRPLLVCTSNKPEAFAKRIAIAWNDSIEISRTIAACLEILKSADYVAVICCQENDKEIINSEYILKYLKAKNINVELVILMGKSRDSAKLIVDTAESKGCDLLVMGAYIHTRMQNLLFGSLTEYVLSNPRINVLLSS